MDSPANFQNQNQREETHEVVEHRNSGGAVTWGLVFVHAIIGFSLLFLAVGVFLAQGVFRDYVNAKRWNDCAQAYQVEFQDQNSNTLVRSPIEDKFQQCLVDTIGG